MFLLVYFCDKWRECFKNICDNFMSFIENIGKIENKVKITICFSIKYDKILELCDYRNIDTN